tara:strand:+ start:1775 stop:2182 length:408 start_codon:yes stop_codon:yes gene_type:complete
MSKFKKFYNKHISETKLLKDNPFFSVLIFLPASITTSILIIPMVIISYPFSYFFREQEIKIMKATLYIQHSIGLSTWLIIEEILLSKLFSFNFSFGFSDVIIHSLIAFILFYNSIKEMIHETLNKTYGDDWMFNM